MPGAQLGGGSAAQGHCEYGEFQFVVAAGAHSNQFAIWRPGRAGERELIRVLSRGEFPFISTINVGNDEDITVLTRKTANKCDLFSVGRKGNWRIDINYYLSRPLRFPAMHRDAMQNADGCAGLRGCVKETLPIVTEPHAPVQCRIGREHFPLLARVKIPNP